MSLNEAIIYIMVDSTQKDKGEGCSINNLKEVGKVFFNKEEHHGVASLCIIKSVEKLNNKVLTGISGRMYDTLKDQHDHHHYSHEDINLHIIYELRWRRCRGFMAIQKSACGTRYLVYLANYMFHSAVSFGTSAEIVDYSQIKECFVKEVKRIRDNWDQHKHSFEGLTDDDFDMDKFDERFGLAN